MASAFFLIMHHVITQGGILSSFQSISFDYIIAYSMEIVSYIFLDCFMLISGFIDTDTNQQISRYMNLYFVVFFYSVGLTTANYLVGGIPFISVIKSALPLNTKVYWYFTAYTLLAITRPILRSYIKHSTNSQLFITIAALVGLCAIPPFLGLNDLYSINNGMSGIWLCIAYLIGAFLKRNEGWNDISKNKLRFVYLITVIILIIVGILLSKYISSYVEWLWRSPSSPILMLAACVLVLLFSRIEMTHKIKKWVQLIAPTSFGVYLIHVHPFLFSLLENRFSYLATSPVFTMVPFIFLICIVYYLFCVLIDLLRNKLFQLCCIKNLSNGIEQLINKHFTQRVNKTITE